MLQLIRDTNISFIQKRKAAYILSLSFIVIGLLSMALHKGLRLGVDFAGGRLIEYRFDQPLPVDQLRGIIQGAGINGAEIQSVGGSDHEFLIRLPVSDDEVAAHDKGPSAVIEEAVSKAMPGITSELRREELVGPKVGDELQRKAFWAVTIAMLGILIYVGIRYEFTFAVGGVAALIHDVLVTLVLFSLFDFEITIPVIAALLTIGGYSINDTVVVFDRIREESKLMAGKPLSEIVDSAVNKTLSRTLITALTTLFSAAALYFFGGEVIHTFAFAMMVGVIVGTYSSIYVASSIAVDIAARRKPRTT